MNRKQILTTIVFGLIIIGFTSIASVFLNSLDPSANSKSEGLSEFSIKDIEVLEEKVVEFEGKPILILRVSENEFEVWDLYPKFKDQRTSECAIKRYITSKSNRPDVAFIEPCRTVLYDSNGNVLEGSDTRALPMKKLIHEVSGSNIYVRANT